MLYAWLDLYAPLVTPVLLLLCVILLAWSYVLQKRVRALQARYNRLTQGVTAENLEDVLFEHVDRVRETVERTRDLESRLAGLEVAARGHVQHVALLRFNPFRRTGGDQSFSLVLTDAQGNGVVVTSLHAREGTRVYAKSLQAWESGHSLMEEEQEAVARARAMTPR